MAKHRAKCGRCSETEKELEQLKRITTEQEVCERNLPSWLEFEFGIQFYDEPEDADIWWGWPTVVEAQKARESEYVLGEAPGMFAQDGKSGLVCRAVEPYVYPVAIWTLTSP